MIDLIEINNGIVDKIKINEKYDLSDYLDSSSNIFDIKKVKVIGDITKIQDELNIKIKINTQILIEDSISLDKVWYPIDIEIDEKLDDFIEKNEKSLDIINFLWQNIVMEVPLRYTEVDNYSKYKGDGWKLVSDEELQNNNPFSKLLESEDWSD